MPLLKVIIKQKELSDSKHIKHISEIEEYIHFKWITFRGLGE